MKKIIFFFLFLLCFKVFSQSLKDCLSSLDNSNQLLERALKEIENLEKKNNDLQKEVEALKAQRRNKEEELIEKIKILEKEKEDLKISIAEASAALKESNELLEKALERIENDQKEIEKLRKYINDLVSAGVKIEIPNWNIMFLGGYPISFGLQVAYNLPWIPSLGALLGFIFSLEEKLPIIYTGVKINLD